jgi:Asp-tRNA(Asn)/Glu-tRNA(Gln) amidotransferase B subunit
MTTLEEKIAFYADRGVTPETTIHVDAEHPEGRSMTYEEFVDYLSVMPDPDTVLTEPPEELKQCWRNRIPEYPKDQWQMEMMVKGFEYLKNNGVDIGPDAGSLVDAVRAVKDKYPKPE